MNTSIEKALDKAFRSDDTSYACLAVAKLFSKSNDGKSLQLISKEIKFDEGSTLFTLDRLINDADIIEYYPEYSKKSPQIIYKYKIKDKYVEYLDKYT